MELSQGISLKRFQQENSTLHISANTIEFLENRSNLSLLSWPEKRPDLNPIKNVLSKITKGVYLHNK